MGQLELKPQLPAALLQDIDLLLIMPPISNHLLCRYHCGQQRRVHPEAASGFIYSFDVDAVTK